MLDARSLSVNITNNQLLPDSNCHPGSCSRAHSHAPHAYRLLAAIFIAALSGSDLAAAGCGKSVESPIARLELIAPLVAHMGPALKLSVGEDGCVLIERPGYYAQPGAHSFRLDATELNSLRSELAAASERLPDAGAIRSTVEAARRAADDAGISFVVADGNLLRLSFRDGDDRRRTYSWRNLEEDLLNHPDIEGLVALGALRDRLVELAGDARMERQP
ncbi:MAG TPA: hypothetical protein PKZ76_02280 [Xanthomonadaceae bacterium]|nr:hypothetical protein [Xanthomonadaceae bacterium]